MSDNMWQRLADKLKPQTLVGESGKISALMGLRSVCLALAAEDAEREGQDAFRARVGEQEWAEMEASPVVSPERASDFLAKYGVNQPAPAPTLPPLDPALVEECARAWAIARGSIQDGIAAALTHYRTRVEGPLREELAKLKGYTQRAQELALHHGDKRMEAMAEADRLRGELNQYDERGHEAKLEIDRLHGELAGMTSQRDAWQAACNRSRQEHERKRIEAASPQPTDEERQRLASEMRYYAGTGASNLVMVHMRADDMRRIATLLEQPAPARKSIGRRWVLTHDADVCSAIYTDELQALRDGIGFWVPVLCDLVPVSGEKP